MELPKFRTQLAYSMPDRAVHQRVTGRKPRKLEIVHPKFTGRARTQAHLESSTIEYAAAVIHQQNLSDICRAVKYEYGIDENDNVFYDPTGDCFWVFPSQKFATQNA